MGQIERVAVFLCDSGNSSLVLCDNLAGGMEWEVAGRLKREGTYVYLGLTHIDIWQKPTEYCIAIISN